MLALKNTFAVLALGIVACSSSPSRAPFPLDEDNNNSEKVPPFGNDTPTTVPQSPVASPAETAAPAAAKPTASAPAPTCPTEQEPNNAADQATMFTGCITGELSGWTDTDYLKITAPKNVTDMIIDHLDPDGTIQYTITAGQNGNNGNGGTSNFNESFTNQAPQTKVTAGQTYVFGLKWDNNGAGAVTDKRSYMIRVSFQ